MDRGDIIGVIAAAHELKTPLVLIRQLSLQLAETTDDQTRKKLTKRIQLTSERSLRLVDGLTKTARLDDALFRLEPIIIHSAIGEIVDEISPLATAMNQKITIKSRKKLSIIGHRELLRTVILGLIDNSIMSGAPNNSVEIRFNATNDKLKISLRDNGAIISKNDFKRIFKKPVNSPSPISSRPLSSGLGLYIANKFTNYMNGEIVPHRHRAGGVSFDIILPLSHQMELFSE